MLLLGIDIGTSSVKVTVRDAATGENLVWAQYPSVEREIISLQPGWAEQSPEQWWQDMRQAILKANATKNYNPKDILAIGISYQMHGLVLVDKGQNSLRDAIIWCDSRAVSIGEAAYLKLGTDGCIPLLNSPGNFTASKLAWVKANESLIYKKVHKIMLPGDFIVMKLTGEISTTPSALSEGIFWDFAKEEISKDVLQCFGFDENIIPEVKAVFSIHGSLKKDVADELGLTAGIPVTYKAGDQLNNALSLNVMQPGEVAATAGTSGVVYAVTDKNVIDKDSRVNVFAHINHEQDQKRLGALLCINGTGIMNSWIKKLCGNESYAKIEKQAAEIEPGAERLTVLPFGNGTERMLGNKLIGAHILNIDLNKHSDAHIYRAVKEGIAFSFRYGMDILRENNINPTVVRAGKANMFLSNVFAEAFANATNVAVELYKNDGSAGAAIGAGIGAKIYRDVKEAFADFHPEKIIEPKAAAKYEEGYYHWKQALQKHLAA